MRRRGLLRNAAAAAFVALIVVSVLTGAGSTPLKLSQAALTAVLAVACFASLIVRRPLLEALLPRVAPAWPSLNAAVQRALATEDGHRHLAVATAIAGVCFSADAVAQVALALTLSTGPFLVASKVVRWAVLAAGAALVVGYLRWAEARVTPARARSGDRRR